MSYYLNKDSDFEDYVNDFIFVDKSPLIDAINANFSKPLRKFMCVTRPRRFGKSMTLSMLNSYYSKGANSKDLFSKLKISKSETFLSHLNKENVIWLDISSVYTNSKDKNEFLLNLEKKIFKDFKKAYPNIDFTDCSIGDAIVEINSSTKEKFVFLIDEWDIIFREKPDSKLCEEYTDFLRSLFKSSDVASCIELVYMTGILPIKRFKTQSTLNMFTEYNMINPFGLSEFIGFTEDEVKSLCNKYNANFDEIKKWYDGYHLENLDIYNPKSVVESITRKSYGDFWTSTSAIEAVTNYMNYDNGSLKDKITLMLTGKKILIDCSSFENDLTKVDSEDAALTVLIHLGYLGYDAIKKECYIPNYEIAQEFEKGLKKLNWKDVYDPISNSLKLYDETLKGNTTFINETLDRNHQELASIFNKNKEDILGVIVHISYYDVNDFYFIRKEDTSTLGRADLSFTPRDNTHIPMIIELKVDKHVDTAINQIKEKNYSSVFTGYKGKILLLGISYNSKTLKHTSKIEYIEL